MELAVIPVIQHQPLSCQITPCKYLNSYFVLEVLFLDVLLDYSISCNILGNIQQSHLRSSVRLTKLTSTKNTMNTEIYMQG